MPKVAKDDLRQFGKAVERARALRGWTLDQLGAAIDPPVGKSLVSKIEKGRKETLSSRTVGRFIKALDLDETLIDPFLGSDTTDEGEETQAERDADRIVDRVTRENATQGVNEDLLILLANKHAEGQHRDLQTAYVALRKALEAAEDIRKRGEMPVGNTGPQLNAVLADVANLNDQGELDQADALLETEENRMRADHVALAERMTEARRQMLEQRLNQDRLRNDPGAAAARLIADLRQQSNRGKLFWVTDDLSREWQNSGDQTGDVFALQVATQIARTNWEKYRRKRNLEAAALLTLGWCYLRLAERSTHPRDLELAHNATKEASDLISKTKDPINWASAQVGFGVVLYETGEREENTDLLRQSVAVYRAALKVAPDDEGAKNIWNNLGNSLQKLGEIAQDPTALSEAIKALNTALSLQNKKTDPLSWAATKNNLALALRWHGELTGDRDLLRQARAGYQACEELEIRDEAEFRWARLQWNIADLALARFALDPEAALLDEADTHVRAAREVFVEGSDYQTERCDALIAQIDAARATI